MANHQTIGDWMSANLFGTDGIRGKVNLAITEDEPAIHRLLECREISPPVFRLVGESLGGFAEFESGKKLRVVVGWDDRPANRVLANDLTIGLNIADFEVVHIGLCATPALHYATLFFDAAYGCMITASHNPVEDSGLKIFSQYGYKTTPQFEQQLSRNVISLSQQKREIASSNGAKYAQPTISHKLAEWCQNHHPNWLSRRYQSLAELIQRDISEAPAIYQPLLIDSSKGTGRFWLADWLSSNGIAALETSHDAVALNDNCGAGDLSPTQEWTFEEAKHSSHILINQLPRCDPGILVGAALDGDGDRCLLIETTRRGFRVIDGDIIADTFLNCVTQLADDWTLAASIESDLSLTTKLDRYSKSVTVNETAVGDRWLTFELCNNKLDEFIDIKKKLHKEYSKYIDKKYLKHFKDIETPWFIDLYCDNQNQREELNLYLSSKNIETRYSYPALSSQSYLQETEKTKLSCSEELSDSILWLPSSTNLTNEEIKYISDEVNKFFNN